MECIFSRRDPRNEKRSSSDGASARRQNQSGRRKERRLFESHPSATLSVYNRSDNGLPYVERDKKRNYSSYVSAVLPSCLMKTLQRMWRYRPAAEISVAETPAAEIPAAEISAEDTQGAYNLIVVRQTSHFLIIALLFPCCTRDKGNQAASISTPCDRKYKKEIETAQKIIPHFKGIKSCIL